MLYLYQKSLRLNIFLVLYIHYKFSITAKRSVYIIPLPVYLYSFIDKQFILKCLLINKSKVAANFPGIAHDDIAFLTDGC